LVSVVVSVGSAEWAADSFLSPTVSSHRIVYAPPRRRQIKVESGRNYYWSDQHGTIVGTNTPTRPNLDFRELVRLP
jgi:hypothetical protein